MLDFNTDPFNEDNIKILIAIYQDLSEKFIIIHYGEMPLVINSQVASHFGLKPDQQIDTFCFMVIMAYMQQMIAKKKIETVTPADFEET